MTGGTYADIGDDVLAVLTELAAPARSCLETGTYQWATGVSTSVAADWFPWLERVVRTDITEGPGVDQAADCHDLECFPTGAFDLHLSRSVWEHLARPWHAAHAAARTLAPGGLLYVATHQTFPVHGYPSDFFRFSTDALRVLVEDAGLETVAVGYTGPADIVPRTEVVPWNPLAPAFLNVQILARKAPR
jgi:SAM-dependent methyltransferase